MITVCRKDKMASRIGNRLLSVACSQTSLSLRTRVCSQGILSRSSVVQKYDLQRRLYSEESEPTVLPSKGKKKKKKNAVLEPVHIKNYLQNGGKPKKKGKKSSKVSIEEVLVVNAVGGENFEPQFPPDLAAKLNTIRKEAALDADPSTKRKTKKKNSTDKTKDKVVEKGEVPPVATVLAAEPVKFEDPVVDGRILTEQDVIDKISEVGKEESATAVTSQAADELEGVEVNEASEAGTIGEIADVGAETTENAVASPEATITSHENLDDTNQAVGSKDVVDIDPATVIAEIPSASTQGVSDATADGTGDTSVEVTATSTAVGDIKTEASSEILMDSASSGLSTVDEKTETVVDPAPTLSLQTDEAPESIFSESATEAPEVLLSETAAEAPEVLTSESTAEVSDVIATETTAEASDALPPDTTAEVSKAASTESSPDSADILSSDTATEALEVLPSESTAESSEVKSEQTAEVSEILSSESATKSAEVPASEIIVEAPTSVDSHQSMIEEVVDIAPVVALEGETTEAQPLEGESVLASTAETSDSTLQDPQVIEQNEAEGMHVEIASEDLDTATPVVAESTHDESSETSIPEIIDAMPPVEGERSDDSTVYSEPLSPTEADTGVSAIADEGDEVLLSSTDVEPKDEQGVLDAAPVADISEPTEAVVTEEDQKEVKVEAVGDVTSPGEEMDDKETAVYDATVTDEIVDNSKVMPEGIDTTGPSASEDDLKSSSEVLEDAVPVIDALGEEVQSETAILTEQGSVVTDEVPAAAKLDVTEICEPVSDSLAEDVISLQEESSDMQLQADESILLEEESHAVDVSVAEPSAVEESVGLEIDEGLSYVVSGTEIGAESEGTVDDQRGMEDAELGVPTFPEDLEEYKTYLAQYRVSDYHNYTPNSYFDLEVEMEEYRMPQPSSREK